MITGTGIAVGMIWERFKDREEVESLAFDYGLSVEDVKEAIQYCEAA